MARPLIDPPESRRVWVVEHPGWDELHCSEYELLEVKAHSIIVSVRGSRGTIREASGRSFFYDRDMVRAHLRAHVKRSILTHERALADLRKCLDREDYPDRSFVVTPNHQKDEKGKLIL